MPAPDKIKQLVETFEQNLNEYHTRKNETELRRQFLDPFFEALGWDVSNNKGNDERRKEVAHELSVEIDGQQKKADYAFRTGVDKFDFLVEAKKPSVRIESNPDPAFQVKRYGWSAKLPVNILTDFEHFAVYDCRAKPNYKDKVTAGRMHLFHYKEYIEKWDEIVALFSPDAVREGALDKYIEGTKGKKGTADVDDDFLAEIERWRDLLAKNIANRNKDKGLNENQLNYAVQMTIDRIVFLRIAEERGMEEYGRLKNLCEYEDIYSELKQYFLKADERYNSGLFHFKTSKTPRDSESLRVSNPDTVTINLQIDDKVLRDIIENLYEPKSPYAFAYIPTDILGSVYERFLGKVIRLTAGGGAKVEDKPEVRKAGGVYYTPVYIVEYIVKNTVGKLTEGKTPKEVAEIKIVDPACGSGSFLLGAYQYLLNWHLDWYTQNDPEKHLKSKVLLTQDNKTYRLSMNEKKRILLNNIHGVDVDPQAVEVTKLSLLLKVVEDPGQLTMFEEGHILPDLGNNIKCGNSLLGMDYFEGQLMTDIEEVARVNPFGWENAFPAVFKRGGFDVVIGNPPYIDIKGLPIEDVRYWFSKYPSANNRINLFAIFIEKSLSIINKSNFKFSMIIPTALLTQESYKALRKEILEKFHVSNIARLPNESFGNAAGDVKVDTVIIVINQGAPSNVEVIAYAGYDRIREINSLTAKISGVVSQADWMNNEDFIWSITLSSGADELLRKIELGKLPLEACAEFCLGVTPYDKYRGHTPSQIENQVFHADYQKDETFKKLLAGNDVRRYSVQWNGEKWISYGSWLGAPREQRFFTQKRILVKQIIDWTTKRIWAAITDEELYNTQNAFNLLPKDGWTNEYLLGIINSKLMTFYHQKKFLDEFKMRFQKILIKDGKRFPIHPINFSDPAEKAKHDQIVTLVERMLALHKNLASAKTPQEKESVQRQVESTDSQIDKLVYELYGLTEDEVKVVEGK